ncbi:hypothetical protein ABZ392_33635 [Streptomyces sp. NPDC005885]|uniref:hypothetical protein n=1 Tax=Streptomyces sp. NPDC005885 TaxID=3157079 RepID=UPI0033C9E3AB
MTVAQADRLWQWHGLTTNQIGRISEAAADGDRCVWCDQVPGAEPIRLFDEAPWLACCRCYMVQLAGMLTWFDWHGHIEGCGTCMSGGRCLVARGRRTLHQQAAALSGETVAYCAPCGEPVTDQDLVVAVVWDTGTRLIPAYAHVLCLALHALRIPS